MINPVELFVGLRYLRAKRRTRFVSFITLISLLGIALGVAALIVILSVMGENGEPIHLLFTLTSGSADQLKQKVFELSISAWDTYSRNLDPVPLAVLKKTRRQRHRGMH